MPNKFVVLEKFCVKMIFWIIAVIAGILQKNYCENMHGFGRSFLTSTENLLSEISFFDSFSFGAKN